MGPLGGDELNAPAAKGNYGWPVVSNGDNYNRTPIPDHGTQPKFVKPPISWNPVISPSGITFYQGTRIPEWENNLFIGALSGQHIARLVIRNNKVVGEERLLASEKQRFRDITLGKDGALYAITDAGRLYKIDKE